jgi:hypothetical protein
MVCRQVMEYYEVPVVSVSAGYPDRQWMPGLLSLAIIPLGEL